MGVDGTVHEEGQGHPCRVDLQDNKILIKRCDGDILRYDSLYFAESYLDWLENHEDLHQDHCHFAKGAR